MSRDPPPESSAFRSPGAADRRFADGGIRGYTLGDHKHGRLKLTEADGTGEVSTITFICGCGHSGTSLLANMFASHPDVYIPLRETNAFLQDRPDLDIWRSVLAETRKSGRAHLVEKTPRHIRALDSIRVHVPGARFILMVRDGRDVAASFIRRYGSAHQGAKRWIEDNALVRAALGKRDVTIVRYEDLVSDPGRELRRLCAFVGLNYEQRMLNYHETKRLWFGVKELRQGSGKAGEEHALLRNWQINQPLYDRRGEWTEKLGHAEKALFESGSAKELLTFFRY